MLYLPEKNVVFIHIPHSAGTSIKAFLERNEFEIKEVFGLHDGVEKIKGTKYEDCYTFCIVRNHWDWILSKWGYVLKKQGDLSPRIYNYSTSLDNSFSDFVLWYLNKESEAPKLPQTHGIFYWTGKKCEKIDNFIRLENGTFGSSGLDDLRDHLDIENFDLPHANQSNKIDRTGIYTKESKERIKNYYQDEINFFSFEF